MNDILKTYKEQFRENRHTLRRYTAFVLALAMITTLFVNWQLHGVGISMTAQYQCGEVEHAHTADCYDKVLICGYTEGQLENADEVAAAEAAAAKKAAEMAKWGPNPIPADQLDGNAYTDDIYLTGKGITFFNIGQTELSPKEKLRLDIIATQIKIYVIEGHADPQTGSKAVNTRLAEQRAKKVYDYLISKGVKAENLQYKGYSDTKSPFKTEQENRVTVIR